MARVVRSTNPPRERRLLALTFDDGPEPVCTSKILDTFARHGGRATFYVRGEAVSGNEGLLARTVAEGHELGNHLFSHPHVGELDDGSVREEIERTTWEIRRAAGLAPTTLRPPYGEDPERVAELGEPLGFPVTALWSVEAEDWKNPSPQMIGERVLAAAAPGAIVLLHDGAPAYDRTLREATAAAVDELVPSLLERRYELVTVSELIASEPARRDSRPSTCPR